MSRKRFSKAPNFRAPLSQLWSARHDGIDHSSPGGPPLPLAP